MSESEPVGSLAQETARLLHALAAEARQAPGGGAGPRAADEPGGGAGPRAADEPGGGAGPRAADEPVEGHVCTTGWCPICNVVGYIHDHPEVVEQVTDAAVEFGRTVRDALARALPPDEK